MYLNFNMVDQQFQLEGIANNLLVKKIDGIVKIINIINI
jgi:hypothetical protein